MRRCGDGETRESPSTLFDCAHGRILQPAVTVCRAAQATTTCSKLLHYPRVATDLSSRSRFIREPTCTTRTSYECFCSVVACSETVFSRRIIFLAYDDYIPGWQGGGCKRFGDSELAAARTKSLVLRPLLTKLVGGRLLVEGGAQPLVHRNGAFAVRRRLSSSESGEEVLDCSRSHWAARPLRPCCSHGSRFAVPALLDTRFLSLASPLGDCGHLVEVPTWLHVRATDRDYAMALELHWCRSFDGRGLIASCTRYPRLLASCHLMCAYHSSATDIQMQRRFPNGNG